MLNVNKADLEYNNIINLIHEKGEWDYGELVRGKYESDGSPAHTKSIFGHQVRFENNTIPLLTSKKVFVLTAVKEAWLFWIMQTVKEKDFKDNNVKIWNQWFREGSLGRSYAYQFESHRHHIRELVKIEPKIKEHHGKLNSITVNEPLSPNFEVKDKHIGMTYSSNNYGDFKVIDMDTSGDRKKYLIQFLDTGYTKYSASGEILSGEVKDNFKRTVCGVGYRGNYESVKNYTENEISKLYNIWRSMITRCYGSVERESYQGRDIFVDKSWHSFENFLREIRYIPQFFLAKEVGFVGYELDKDYYSSNCYSKDTCVFITTYENKLYRENIKPFYAIDKDGNKKLYISQQECAIDLGLSNSTTISGCLNNRASRKTSKGHTFVYLNDDSIYRYELSKNQVVDLINNIKNNPQSRRLMTSFWNDADVDKKELQECAWSTQYNIKGGYMDSLLIQRSVDVGLGLPFNWIQYWIIGNVLAHVNGYKYRNFVHQMGNVHYYDRHEDSLLEQIDNEIYETPVIKINENLKDFFDFTPNDITIEYYECGEYIKLEVAV